MSVVIGFRITDTGKMTPDGMADIYIEKVIIPQDATDREMAICEAFKLPMKNHAQQIIEESLRDGDRSVVIRGNPK